MKHLILGTAAAALLSGMALTSAVQAAPYGHGYGNGHGYRHALTPHERALLAQSRFRLNALRWRARADGHVSGWERARINAALARHRALAYRFRHN